jgi:VIT1/CCC1 family predicted Fe2+/Mn2+ transporter
MDAKLWFVQLSGWPVFLAIVAVVFLSMMALSVWMTRISNRSVAQNAVLAVGLVAVIGFGLLGFLAVLTRW